MYGHQISAHSHADLSSHPTMLLHLLGSSSCQWCLSSSRSPLITLLLHALLLSLIILLFESRWALSWVTSTFIFVISLCVTPVANAFWAIKQRPAAMLFTIKCCNQCCCLIRTHSGYRQGQLRRQIEIRLTTGATHTENTSESSNYRTPTCPEWFSLQLETHVTEDSQGPGEVREKCVAKSFWGFIVTL